MQGEGGGTGSWYIETSGFIVGGKVYKDLRRCFFMGILR